ncbi:MAG: ABC transporter substrate-binding protein [Rhodospirillales bacterium]
MNKLFPALILSIVVLLQCASGARAESLRVATSTSGWAIWIAKEMGFFEEAGVDVEVELVASGVAAGGGLIDGNYDVATMSGFAFVARSFNHPDLRVIGTVASIANVHLIARADRGISGPADLKGKRIGLRGGSISEFFLGRLLDLHKVRPTDIKTVDIAPPDLPKALSDGVVDAIVSWQPYAKQAADGLGIPSVDITVQGGQSYYFDLVVRKQTLTQRRGDLKRLLEALVRASEWASANEEAAKTLLSEALDVDRRDIDTFWHSHSIDVALSQDMIFLMEQEAVWRVANGYSEGAVPDFLERIDTELLSEIDPVLVTVIE